MAKKLVDISLDLELDLERQDSLYLKEAPSEAGQSSYEVLNNSQAVSSLVKAGGKAAQSLAKPNKFTGTIKLEVGGVEIELDDFMNKDNKPQASLLNENTSKLLTMIVAETSKHQTLEGGTIRFALSLEDYAAKLGASFDSTSAGRKAKQRLKQDFFKALETLEKTRIKIQEHNAKRGSPSIGSIPLMYYKPINERKGLTEIVVIEDFISYLQQSYYFIQHYKGIYKLTGGAYHLNYNFCRYHNHLNNQVEKKPGQPKQAHIFSLKQAIEWTEGALPTLEYVKSTDRHYEERILKPLFLWLEHEDSMIKHAQLCKAKGQRFTAEELANGYSYEMLNKAYIYVTAIKGEQEFKDKIAPYLGKKLITRDKVKQRKEREDQRGKAELDKGKYKDI